MNNQNYEIVPQTMNEIECLNEIVELDLESLEAIVGGQKVDIDREPVCPNFGLLM